MINAGLFGSLDLPAKNLTVLASTDRVWQVSMTVSPRSLDKVPSFIVAAMFSKVRECTTP